MITFKEAEKIVMEAVVPLPAERLILKNTLNRVLAENAISDVDMPPFNKAAMDGFACRQQDIARKLKVVETIPAGRRPEKTIGSGECAKIMTGAMVPSGADCVIMVEFTETDNNGSLRFTKKTTDENICYKGEDVKKGDVVLDKGQLLFPQHIAILAATGCAEPMVSMRPHVGIITTGSELIKPSESVKGAMIRDSNGIQLATQAKQMGCEVNNYGIVCDTENAIDVAFKKAMSENHVIIISGGVSMGDFDFVPKILRGNGFQILFDRVAVKPGKPSTFAVTDNIRCFGLPGNPVSTFLQFELLIKPFLYKMMNHQFKPKIIQAKMCGTITRSKTVRTSFYPVKFISPSEIIRIEYHGSAHINAITEADGIVTLPIGKKSIRKGAKVDVRLF